MIYELLAVGEQNARTSKELSNACNIEVRDVMQAIRVERLAGKPICSTSKGYFLPADISDLNRTISRLYKQSRETRRVAEAMRKARDKG